MKFLKYLYKFFCVNNFSKSKLLVKYLLLSTILILLKIQNTGSGTIFNRLQLSFYTSKREL